MAAAPLSPPLQALARCFEAVIPSMLTTVSPEGVPNLVALSDVHLVDDRHVAVSRQFFRKTQANLAVNPLAQLAVTDPVTQETYRLAVRFAREERSGPLFDAMAARLAAVASMSGMAALFRLAAAVVFEVLAVEQVAGVMRPGAPLLHGVAAGGAIAPLTQLRALRAISDALQASDDVGRLLDAVLAILDEVLGFRHTRLLLVDESGERLFVVASRGHEPSGEASRASLTGRPPRLPGAESQLALPLLARGELLGVLSVESPSRVAHDEADELFLEVVAGKIAVALQDLMGRPEEPPVRVPAPAHEFVFYPADDCMFVDGRYLVGGVPARMLWHLLRAHLDEGRTEFSNRELRLALRLPAVRDNIESRIILLRRRLAERCPGIGLVPIGRGQFALEVRGRIALAEKT